MKRILLSALILCTSLVSIASERSHEYQCDLNGGKEPLGTKITIFLEDKTPVLMECKIVLGLSFLGDATYKASGKADWVQFSTRTVHPSIKPE